MKMRLGIYMLFLMYIICCQPSHGASVYDTQAFVNYVKTLPNIAKSTNKIASLIHCFPGSTNKPSKGAILKVCTEYERLKKPIEVRYSLSEQIRGSHFMSAILPYYKLIVDVGDDAARIIEDNEKHVVVFALLPFLRSENDADAYLVLYVASNCSMLVRRIEDDLPYREGSPTNNWDTGKTFLKSLLRDHCIRVLGTAGYDVRDFAE